MKYARSRIWSRVGASAGDRSTPGAGAEMNLVEDVGPISTGAWRFARFSRAGDGCGPPARGGTSIGAAGNSSVRFMASPTRTWLAQGLEAEYACIFDRTKGRLFDSSALLSIAFPRQYIVS